MEGKVLKENKINSNIEKEKRINKRIKTNHLYENYKNINIPPVGDPDLIYFEKYDRINEENEQIAKFFEFLLKKKKGT